MARIGIGSVLKASGIVVMVLLMLMICAQVAGLLRPYVLATSGPATAAEVPPAAVTLRCDVPPAAPVACRCTRGSCTCSSAAPTKASAPEMLRCVADASAAGAPASSPREPAPSGPPSPADVLSTLSLVVAVVTLLLTYGSTYLATKQEQLSRLIDRDTQRERLQLALYRAQSELLNFFKGSGIGDPVESAALVGALLACLRTPDEGSRIMLNMQIASYLGPHQRAALPDTAMYCHELERWLQSGRDTCRQPTHVCFFDGNVRGEGKA